MPDPAVCTDLVNPNYTINTFRLYLTPVGGPEIDMGNVQTGNFQVTHQTLEHRAGIDNSLDSVLRVGTDYYINATLDEITPDLLSVITNEDFVAVAEGCKIPLTGSNCAKIWGVRFNHAFPCSTKNLNIYFWAANVLGDFPVNFDAGAVAAVPLVIRALKCDIAHPAEPYGYMVMTQPCPRS